MSFKINYRGGLRLRSKPNGEVVLTTICCGEIVTHLETRGDWIKCKFNEHIGWLPLLGGRGEKLLASSRSFGVKVLNVPKTASTSHERSEEYMTEFKSALEEMGEKHVENDPYIQSYTRGNSSVHQEPVNNTKNVNRVASVVHNKKISSMAFAAGSGGFNMQTSPSSMLDLSDRNILCSSIYKNEIVLGCADHALYVLKCNGCRLSKARTLYNKRNGHSEWVTCVTHTGDGGVISGGMDSKLCLWRGVCAIDFPNVHTGSISQIRCNSSNIAISSSYDRSLCVWNNVGTKPRVYSHIKRAHDGPILDFYWNFDSNFVSGGRDGFVKIWDLVSTKCTNSFSHLRKGHVTSLHQLSTNLIVSGGQDGLVKIWDCQ